MTELWVWIKKYTSYAGLHSCQYLLALFKETINTPNPFAGWPSDESFTTGPSLLTPGRHLFSYSTTLRKWHTPYSYISSSISIQELH